MKLIGITGGIGMGKSTSAELLIRRGYPVIDTDQIARDVVESGQPALKEVQAVFGNEIVDASGRLRRELLASKVFANPQLRRSLEEILHPRIRQAWKAKAEEWERQGHRLGFVIIPLLFETNAPEHFSAIICVACTESTQLERLRGRGWSDLEIQRRIDAQWPVQQKIDKSDFVIWTETTMEKHAAQLDWLLEHDLH